MDDDFVARIEGYPDPLITIDGLEFFQGREMRFLFFDKGPEFVQLALFQVIVLAQMLTHALAMCGSLFKDERDGVLIDVKDSRASANAVAFGQCFEHSIDRLLIGVKADKDAVVTSAKLTTTFQTAIERRAVWPVRTNQLEILLDSLALVRVPQRAS